MGLSLLVAGVVFAIGFPALLGLWTVHLWTDRLPKDHDVIVRTPAGLAVGFSLVVVSCAYAAIAPDFATIANGWIRYAGLLAFFLYVVGITIGYLENRSKSRR